jgi:lipoprotein-anchoring transpeptidase ErfK/SrfK
MKTKLLTALITLILFAPTGQVIAQDGGGDLGLPLCLPGMTADGTCLLYGPAQTVAKMEEKGFPYPPLGIPAASPPRELGVLPVYVAKINLPNEQRAPIYASFDDAVAGVNEVSYIESGSLRYISYVSRADHDGNPYLQLASGGWLRASPAAYTDFQGLLFYENPRNDFGWIIDHTPSYSEPTFSSQTTGKEYYQDDVIQVYQTVEAEQVLWYEIAPDEWVNSMKARIVTFDPTRPDGVEGDRWIEINLFQETLSVYEDGNLIFATLVASGVEPFYTKPGVFQIYEKKPLETMRGSFEADRSDYYYLEDVPWTMYYDEARALHATYWHTLFGYRQSHGCINLSPGDANWLYQWADVGEYVWVHDPSGMTPTDPDFYGPGAP